MFSKEFNKKEDYYINKLNQNREVIFLEKDVVFRQCKNVLKKVGETEGLWCDSSTVRYYPYKEIASHITGFVNSENKGQYGIEMQYDKVLRGGIGKMEFEVTPSNKKTLIKRENADRGKDIHLTLNINYQSILIEEMNKGLLKHNAKSASGIIMDPKTGSILAMGSVPSYDPNEYGSFSDKLYINRAVTDLYEPGSIFKIIPIAAAIEEEFITMHDSIFCDNGKYTFPSGRILRDHDEHGKISVQDIFAHSSNIGIAKIIDLIGDKTLYKYCRDFGIGAKVLIDLPNVEKGKLRPYRDWNSESGAIVAIGQEVSATLLQMSVAYCSIANGGIMLSPKIIKTGFYPEVRRQVISKNTAEKIRNAMEVAVLKGSAQNSKMSNYSIGGKTGTAQKIINGKYSEKEFISSYASIFPVENPQFVCIISVDSPDYGFHWGNFSAAPIVKEIYNRIIMSEQIKNNDIALFK